MFQTKLLTVFCFLSKVECSNTIPSMNCSGLSFQGGTLFKRESCCGLHLSKLVGICRLSGVENRRTVIPHTKTMCCMKVCFSLNHADKSVPRNREKIESCFPSSPVLKNSYPPPKSHDSNLSRFDATNSLLFSRLENSRRNFHTWNSAANF